jgi:hypothetical protein
VAVVGAVVVAAAAACAAVEEDVVEAVVPTEVEGRRLAAAGPAEARIVRRRMVVATAVGRGRI